jgi:hypothetical protein
MYDRYTNRFDPNFEEKSPIGLQATTANDYYDFARSFGHFGFGHFKFDHFVANVLNVISNAEQMYSQS